MDRRLDDHIREDLPGAIDFILEKVARKNLHVVSYSKSTTVTFGMLASKPDYNEKVRLHISMMPVTYVENPTAVFKAMLGIFGRLTQVSFWGGVGKFMFVLRFAFILKKKK